MCAQFPSAKMVCARFPSANKVCAEFPSANIFPDKIVQMKKWAWFLGTMPSYFTAVHGSQKITEKVCMVPKMCELPPNKIMIVTY